MHHTISFNVPLAYYYNRPADPNTGNAGDATFPRHIFLTSYSFRLGQRISPATDPLPPKKEASEDKPAGKPSEKPSEKPAAPDAKKGSGSGTN